jgi:Pectate lyase superfamily protein
MPNSLKAAIPSAKFPFSIAERPLRWAWSASGLMFRCSMVDCPACGEKVKPGVAVCKRCRAILDEDKPAKRGLPRSPAELETSAIVNDSSAPAKPATDAGPSELRFTNSASRQFTEVSEGKSMVIPIRKRVFIWTFVVTTVAGWLAAASTPAFGQGSRKDDRVLSTSGHMIPEATIRVCQSGASGTPCSPLATIYTDAALIVAAPNPFQTDGLGNHHFYAPAGRYLVQITGTRITGTRTYRDVILAPDVSSSGEGNNMSAFSLALGGNLTAGGNATIDGTLTTADFNPGTFTPSSLSVSGNETITGPRPRADVTAYGAKGDASTNDTAAIQAAINAVCSYDQNHKPVLFFPPGTYIVSQPQGGSSHTASVFTGWCAHLVLEGSGGNSSSQFSTSPQSRIVVQAGANPGAGPVFQPVGGSANGAAIRNLEIDGYNQAVYLQGTSALDINGFNFDNVCLVTSATGYSDNVPLKMSQIQQIGWRAGCIQAGNGSLDDVLIIGADFGGSETEPASLIFFDGTLGNFWVGSGIHYDQRVNTCCSGPGNFHFKNILIEDATKAPFRVTNSSGNPNALNFMSDVELENFGISDGPAPSLVNFNVANAQLIGLHIKGGGAGNALVVMQAGTLRNCDVWNGGQGANTNVVDGSGNVIGDCVEQTPQGIASIVDTSDLSRLGGEPSQGSSLESFAAGNPFASLNIDPTQGLMLKRRCQLRVHGAALSDNEANDRCGIRKHPAANRRDRNSHHRRDSGRRGLLLLHSQHNGSIVHLDEHVGSLTGFQRRNLERIEPCNFPYLDRSRRERGFDQWLLHLSRNRNTFRL